MRQAALSRKPMTDQVRAKISANSTISHLCKVSKLNEEPLNSLKETFFINIRTINAVAEYCKCNAKTVRRALKSKGIIKGQLIVSKI